MSIDVESSKIRRRRRWWRSSQ